ncbi:MAG: T9SS type A sorting domain-containing protein, partial [Bacteroidota bacterium]|nr:T9SS type A sorting domain-containing protein [Bacteroidota bacterium]
FLKNWILQRIIFMDDYLPGACITTALNETSTDWQLTVSPNPADDYLRIAWNKNANVQIDIFDAVGKKVVTISPQKSGVETLNISDWKQGMYFVQLVHEGKSMISKKMVKL